MKTAWIAAGVLTAFATFAVGRYTSVLSLGARERAVVDKERDRGRDREVKPPRPVRRLAPLARANDVDRADFPVSRESAPATSDGDAEREYEEASHAPAFKTAADERDYFLESIQGTGSPTGQSIELMRSVEREWNQMVREATSDLELGSWRCFQAGCTMTIRYRTQATAEPLLDRMMASQAATLVPGQRFLSGPVPSADGLTEMTWIFFFSPQPGTVSDG